jgi:hypothetical protein
MHPSEIETALNDPVKKKVMAFLFYAFEDIDQRKALYCKLHCSDNEV